MLCSKLHCQKGFNLILFSYKIAAAVADDLNTLISHKVFLKSFCKSQFPHKFVNLFFILIKVTDKLTDLWGS